jgi:hypothetical protein
MITYGGRDHVALATEVLVLLGVASTSLGLSIT